MCVCVCVCVCVYMYGLHHQDVRHESEADSCHLPHCIVIVGGCEWLQLSTTVLIPH